MEKMKAYKLYTAIFLLGIFAVSCRQDPIFFIISTETVPIPPRIEGAPTNMVVFKRNGTDVVYVASGRLHWYAKPPTADEPRWDLRDYRIPQPGGKIISLAVAGERLYALCLNSDSINATLRYIGPSDTAWRRVEGVSDYPLIQSIYADPEKPLLFAGARKRGSVAYALLYLNDTDNTLEILRQDTAMLSGAVHRDDSYYLCTRGSGIFQVDESEMSNHTPPSIKQLNYNRVDDNDKKTSSLSFMGMIKLKDESSTIIAVERNGGGLYEIFQDGAFAKIINDNGNSIAVGRYATGALAVWEDYLDPGKKLLVAGMQSGLYSTSTSSYTNGYVEFELTPGGALDKNSPTCRHDSNRLQTVDSTDRYTTSLGKHPINHLFQTPREIDSNMIFFASTQTTGLWSYRLRDNNGGWQWNAEE